MTLAFLLLASLLAAVVSGSAGFGGSLLLLPLVTALLGAEHAVPVLTLAQLLGNLSRVAAGWRQIAWRPVLLFCATALPLAGLGALGLTLLPKDLVTRCVGAAIVALVLVRLLRRDPRPTGTRGLLVGGAVTGGVSGLAGSGGPIGAAVFLGLELPPLAYVASEAVTATAMHVLKIGVYAQLGGMTWPAAGTGALMGLAMAVGTMVARQLVRGVAPERFQRWVAVLLVAVGAWLLLVGA